MELNNDSIFIFLDHKQLITILVSLTLNLIVVSAIIIPKFILKQQKEFAISLYLFNFVIFALCYIMSRSDISTGAGIGLFAVFSMLRFRSEMLKLSEMTYLLVIICIGFVNAVFNGSISLTEVILLNLGLCILIYLLDDALSLPRLKCKKIKYGNLDLIKPDRNTELIKDLAFKTGLDIRRVQIDSINLNEQIANILVFFRDRERRKNEMAFLQKFLTVFKRNGIAQNH